MSKVQELAFVVWWWWWCRCWWFWLNACNIYIFQLFSKIFFLTMWGHILVWISNQETRSCFEQSSGIRPRAEWTFNKIGPNSNTNCIWGVYVAIPKCICENSTPRDERRRSADSESHLGKSNRRSGSKVMASWSQVSLSLGQASELKNLRFQSETKTLC